MNLRRLSAILAVLLLLAGTISASETNKATAATAGPRDNYNIPLWEAGKVPNAKGDGPLDAPFLTVFLPPPGKANGSSVVIAPGGADIMLMYSAEGLDIAERYNEWGTAAFVLTYRLSPRYNAAARIADGQRAIRVVRSLADKFHLDTKKVGYIGFSAGSNMGRSVVASSGPGDPAAADPIDRLSSRPDYLGLVYGAGRATPGEDLKSFPPTFLLSAAGDTGPSMGNAQLLMDMLRAKAVVELHIYQKGHHGFGDGFASPTYSDWMGRLELFLRQGGFLPGGRPE